jgi:putative SOS response-associated peptidase YedK
MCGRFGLSEPEFSETRFQALPLPEVAPLLIPRYNIAPTQDVLTVAVSKRLDGARSLKAMRWGLVAEWALNDRRKPRPINLKAENLLDRPYSRRLLERRRCIIPADGFYEWDKLNTRKQPWNIGIKGRGIFAFAGVWDACKAGDDWLVSCAILTIGPNELVGRLHDRMPVILGDSQENIWLSEDAALPDLVPCLTAYPAGLMESYPVSGLVSDVKNEGAELRQPPAHTMFTAAFTVPLPAIEGRG